MMNKLDAVKIFVSVAETLNFREAAVKSARSSSAVTRAVSDLEHQLGEPLFTRNTRSVVLTAFGERFLPGAKRLLEDADVLFQKDKDNDEMKGVVRITLFRFSGHEQVLYELLTALRPYPDLSVDWRLDLLRLDTVRDRVDIGLRIERDPNPNFIIRPITQVRHILVASPDLMDRLGYPEDVEDLRRRYPFGGLLNPETGKVFEFMLDGAQSFVPRNLIFTTTDAQSGIQAALAGKAVVQCGNLICGEYLNNGRLVNVFPDLQLETWLFYLYRPYQSIVPGRVRKVFEILEEILIKRFK